MVGDYRVVRAEMTSEIDLQTHILLLARHLGFLAYHTHDSRRSEKGFPDLVLVKEGRLIFAELKRQKGTYGPGQEDWLKALDSTCAEVYTWRPLDWFEGRISLILQGAEG